MPFPPLEAAGMGAGQPSVVWRIMAGLLGEIVSCGSSSLSKCFLGTVEARRHPRHPSFIQ